MAPASGGQWLALGGLSCLVRFVVVRNPWQVNECQMKPMANMFCVDAANFAPVQFAVFPGPSRSKARNFRGDLLGPGGSGASGGVASAGRYGC